MIFTREEQNWRTEQWRDYVDIDVRSHLSLSLRLSPCLCLAGKVPFYDKLQLISLGYTQYPISSYHTADRIMNEIEPFGRRLKFLSPFIHCRERERGKNSWAENKKNATGGATYAKGHIWSIDQLNWWNRIRDIEVKLLSHYFFGSCLICISYVGE